MSLDTRLEVDPQLFKDYLQKEDWDCGLRVAAYLAGISNDETNKEAIDRLFNELHINKDEGTDILAIEDYFSSRPEYDAVANTDWTLNGIQKELERGRVCVVSFQNWQKPDDKGKPDWGHYGIIYKIDDGRVYMFDPGEDDGKKDYSIADFLERWYELDFGRDDPTKKVPWTKWAMSVDMKAARSFTLAHEDRVM